MIRYGFIFCSWKYSTTCKLQNPFYWPANFDVRLIETNQTRQKNGIKFDRLDKSCIDIAHGNKLWFIEYIEHTRSNICADVNTKIDWTASEDDCMLHDVEFITHRPTFANFFKNIFLSKNYDMWNKLLECMVFV